MLSVTMKDDSWMWLEDDKEGYSVKSAYRLFCKLHDQVPNILPDLNWLKLWALSAPPKIKNFM